MARKTNKTSHVMNLLTNGAGDASPAPASPVLEPPGKSTGLKEEEINRQAASQIASGLSRELSREQKNRKEAPVSSNPPKDPPESTICFINVMEELVRKHHKVKKLMEEYNVCTCDRCQADVCALALSNLPPKYIVAERSSLPILISYYENRYRAPIFTQLVKACIEVHNHPRHNRSSA